MPNCMHVFCRVVVCSVPLFAASAWANTLCVTANGQLGCYNTISKAIAAAAIYDTVLVGPGTFHESVTINRPVSLVSLGATIDAKGLGRGIFVDGLDNPGLQAVHVSGFTVENAQLEGILVLNASDVTLSNNQVQNNNQALDTSGASGPNCTALPGFEPGEAQDCGEGIHLQAADHSIVTGNTVRGNAGGILISDDTGTAHDNLVSYNVVRDNPNACGITMASHVPAASTNSTVPLGVFHNTVYKNQSMHNGAGIGGGAGVGIFASVPGAMAYANVVVENTLSRSGHPGISLHAHVPGQKVDDNMLIGNVIEDNGADGTSTPTPGTAGINVFAAGAITGNIISANTITQENNDVVVTDSAIEQVEFNSLLGGEVGVNNVGAGGVDATNNWWGCVLGPQYGPNCSRSSGLNLTEPWALLPLNP